LKTKKKTKRELEGNEEDKKKEKVQKPALNLRRCFKLINLGIKRKNVTQKNGCVLKKSTKNIRK